MTGTKPKDRNKQVPLFNRMEKHFPEYRSGKIACQYCWCGLLWLWFYRTQSSHSGHLRIDHSNVNCFRLICALRVLCITIICITSLNFWKLFVQHFHIIRRAHTHKHTHGIRYIRHTTNQNFSNLNNRNSIICWMWLVINWIGFDDWCIPGSCARCYTHIEQIHFILRLHLASWIYHSRYILRFIYYKFACVQFIICIVLAWRLHRTHFFDVFLSILHA